MIWSMLPRMLRSTPQGEQRIGRRTRKASQMRVESLEGRELMAGGFGNPAAAAPNRPTTDQLVTKWKADWNRTTERIVVGTARTFGTFSGVGRLAPAAWSALSGLQKFGAAANLGRNLFSTFRDPFVRTTPTDRFNQARDWWSSAIEDDFGDGSGDVSGFVPFSRMNPGGWMRSYDGAPWSPDDDGTGGGQSQGWDHPQFDNAIDYGNYWTDYVHRNQ